jgi:hypothetical protein
MCRTKSCFPGNPRQIGRLAAPGEPSTRPGAPRRRAPARTMRWSAQCAKRATWAAAASSAALHHVADPVQGMDRFVLEWVVNLGPESAHGDFDDVRVRIKMNVSEERSVSACERALARPSAPRARAAREFLRREIYAASATRGTVAHRVDLIKPATRSLGSLPPPRGAHRYRSFRAAACCM